VNKTHRPEPGGFDPSYLDIGPHRADANTTARAALYVQGVLRRDYDLMTD
jgi:hypothetical protein